MFRMIRVSLTTLAACAPMVTAAAETNFKALYVFSPIGSGQPSAPYNQIAIVNGLLYGTTVFGGTINDGVLYSLSLDTKKFKNLYSFGWNANGAQGVLRVDGKLYMPTASGTPEIEDYALKSGVERLYTTLRRYNSNASLSALSVAGTTLYGASSRGGAMGDGSVYQVAPDHKTTILHSFTGGADGNYPDAAVVVDNGTLYGTTFEGGADNMGVIYSIDLSSGAEKILYNFTGDDGAFAGGISAPTGGVFYGVTFRGGSTGAGTVYSFNTATNTLTTLYTFTNQADGSNPLFAPLLVNDKLYVTSQQGSNSAGAYGAVISLNLKTGTETTLHSLNGTTDGGYPDSPLVLDRGKLYGIANGGEGVGGSVFEVTP
jgi:uncharacterized repeat protein (TIGR03803 family)